ncbi:MAG: alginate export family protein [Planctomycetota bacterium]|jgi:hypothetical protein
MKKSFIVIISVFFVLGLTVSAFAIHAEIPAETQAVVAKDTTQITLGGSIRVRGELKQNTDVLNDDKSDDSALYETRVRLKLQAQITPNTRAMVELRDTKLSGDDDMTWGSPGSRADSKGIYTKGGEVAGNDETDLSFIQAWIQHTSSGLLGIPAGIKIGHMPLALGNALFFSHTKNGDDAVLIFADPTEELHIALLNIKLDEGSGTLNDDADAYVGLFNYSRGGFNVGGDVTFINDQEMSSDGLHFWNFGLRGDTQIADLTLRGDIEAQTGEAKGTSAFGTDVDFNGLAFLIGADYEIADIRLSGEVVYGSGDDTGTTDEVEMFVNAIDNTQHYTYVYEYRSRAATGAKLTGIANTLYYNVGVFAKPTPDVSVSADVYYLQAVEDVALNGASPDDYLGWEIDGKMAYEIDKNLTYYVEGGILFPGDAYDLPDGDADNAYAIRNGLILSF